MLSIPCYLSDQHDPGPALNSGTDRQMCVAVQVANRLRQLRGDLDRAQATLGLQAEAAAAAGASPMLGGRRLEACLDAEDQPDPAAIPSAPSHVRSPVSSAESALKQQTQGLPAQGRQQPMGRAATGQAEPEDAGEKAGPSNRTAPSLDSLPVPSASGSLLTTCLETSSVGTPLLCLQGGICTIQIGSRFSISKQIKLLPLVDSLC